MFVFASLYLCICLFVFACDNKKHKKLNSLSLVSLDLFVRLSVCLSSRFFLSQPYDAAAADDDNDDDAEMKQSHQVSRPLLLLLLLTLSC